MQQACALPFRRQDGKIEFCLITTRLKKCWSFPKGSVEQGETLSDAAVRETLEEAGLDGCTLGEPLGEFDNTRYEPPRKVIVFLMEVTQVHDQWPEDGERQRCWCDLDETLRRLDFKHMRQMVHTAVERLEEK